MADGLHFTSIPRYQTCPWCFSPFKEGHCSCFIILIFYTQLFLWNRMWRLCFVVDLFTVSSLLPNHAGCEFFCILTWFWFLSFDSGDSITSMGVCWKSYMTSLRAKHLLQLSVFYATGQRNEFALPRNLPCAFELESVSSPCPKNSLVRMRQKQRINWPIAYCGWSLRQEKIKLELSSD